MYTPGIFLFAYAVIGVCLTTAIVCFDLGPEYFVFVFTVVALLPIMGDWLMKSINPKPWWARITSTEGYFYYENTPLARTCRYFLWGSAVVCILMVILQVTLSEPNSDWNNLINASIAVLAGFFVSSVYYQLTTVQEKKQQNRNGMMMVMRLIDIVRHMEMILESNKKWICLGTPHTIFKKCHWKDSCPHDENKRECSLLIIFSDVAHLAKLFLNDLPVVLGEGNIQLFVILNDHLRDLRDSPCLDNEFTHVRHLGLFKNTIIHLIKIYKNDKLFLSECLVAISMKPQKIQFFTRYGLTTKEIDQVINKLQLSVEPYCAELFRNPSK